MARRPTAPRPASTTRRATQSEKPDKRAERPAERTDKPAKRTEEPAKRAEEPAPPVAPSQGPEKSAPRSAAPTYGWRAEPQAELGTPREERGGERVVQAADRFRGLVAGRPWRRRRRAIITGAVITALLLLAALSAAIWLPALRLQQITVSGLGYVQEQTVREQLDGRLGDSVLLLPTEAISEDVTTIPGVHSAQVERRWPDGMHVTVVEAEPVAQLTRADGTAAVVDASGAELPPEAAEGATLVPLTVAPTSQDPEGAAEALTEVLAELPDPLRPALQGMTASSPSDVTFTLALEDGGTKTVVWGDSRDAELKGEVVQALLPEPGSVIDVSSPVAPVTR